MTQTLLRIAAIAAAALGVLAPAASAEAILEVEMTARHIVAWNVADEDEGQACESWSVGSGTQVIEVETARPERLEAERLFGKLALTTDRAGTFTAEIKRRGTWKAHVTPGDTPECSPCGPLSEYGECKPPNKQPTFTFRCGTKPIKGYNQIGLGYQRATAVPDLMHGLTISAGVASTELFENCPPTFEGSSHGIKTTRFTMADLPKSFSKAIADLRRGQSASAKASAEVGVGMGKPKDSCKAVKPVKDGYSECALSTYQVKVTRIR